MTDVKFVQQSSIRSSRPAASLVGISLGGTVGGGAKPPGLARRSIDRLRGVIRRRPMAARIMGIACLFSVGWFLLMAPLFIAQQ
jgi:hypothetical protein